MKCNKFQKWLSLDMDGELSPAKKSILVAHLDDCERCRKTASSWAGVRAELRGREVPGAQTAEEAWAGVRRAIREDVEQPSEKIIEWVPLLKLQWGTLAAAMMLLIAGLTWRTLQPDLVVTSAEEGMPTTVEMVETDLPDAAPMVYEDSESGWVVIWVMDAKETDHAGS